VWRQVPNLITTSRLILSVVFFTILSWYQYDGRGHSTLLTWGFAICLIAISTDYVDGYLARKWKVESAFGRVVDPFVDKILVLGSFIFFAGKNFIIPVEGHPHVVFTITGVTPMMVVILLGRELLVTSLRGMFESKGTDFGAVWAGKAKMVLQSVATLVIVAYVYFLALLKGRDSPWLNDYELWATLFRDVILWMTLIVTVWSCYGYVRRSIAVMRAAPP